MNPTIAAFEASIFTIPLHQYLIALGVRCHSCLHITKLTKYVCSYLVTFICEGRGNFHLRCLLLLFWQYLTVFIAHCKILEMESHKNLSPLATHFTSNLLEKRPNLWGSFSRDPGPEFPGNGNAKNPGIPGNFPSRDSRPTALFTTDSWK